jgi:hypothetical protein
LGKVVQLIVELGLGVRSRKKKVVLLGRMRMVEVRRDKKSKKHDLTEFSEFLVSSNLHLPSLDGHHS